MGNRIPLDQFGIDDTNGDKKREGVGNDSTNESTSGENESDEYDE